MKNHINTTVKILLIFMVIQIFIILGIMGIIWVTNVQEAKQCESNREEIEAKVNTFVNNKYQEFPRESNYPINLEELPGDYNIEDIQCPSGGTYYWDPMSGTVACDVKNHLH